MKRVIVVGGGPSGMMAAISSASLKNQVILVEKNPYLGKKLLLTGGGRCNLTNACAPEELVEHYSKTGDFLRDAFKTLDNRKLIRFFEQRGLKTKVEDKNRVFPISDKASSILDVLEKEMKKLGVKILYKKDVRDVIMDKDTVRGVSCSDGIELLSEKVIIATGGLSYGSTGSTGRGIKIAERTRHKVVGTRPGLVSLELKKGSSAGLEGLSFLDARLIFISGKKKFISQRGGLLFTKEGISGPAVFSASAEAVKRIDGGKRVYVDIDVLPEKTSEELEKFFLTMTLSYPKRNIKNILSELVPARIAGKILDEAGIRQGEIITRVKQKDVKNVISFLKGSRFEIVKHGDIEKAQITCGGVSTKDIDPVSMGSKKVKGMYFAGEMIDIDGDCGGFNLQAAFSTGYLAGRDK
ncbi:MAG: NAD(P)/FAD-dependent oxidoreductase [Candidatus Omnitrophota bacterium]